MPKANMRDVAQHANVSVATVSHVINNTRFVSEGTRKRVMDSIAALDYRPDAMARIFKTGRSNLIGLLVPDLANGFFAAVVGGVEGAVGGEGFRLVVAGTGEAGQREEESVRALASGMVDGLIVAGAAGICRGIGRMAPEGLPTVLIGSAAPDCPYDTVTISHDQAVRLGVEALIREGHRRIGYIAGFPGLSETGERLAAYRRAMEARGLSVEGDCVRFRGLAGQGAAPHAERLLELGCTALVVSDGAMTDEVLYFLDERGVEPGDGIAVVGYGDREGCDLRRIHRIRQPAGALGRAAGLLLLDRIARPDLPASHTVLQAFFVRREAAPPGAAR